MCFYVLQRGTGNKKGRPRPTFFQQYHLFMLLFYAAC